MPSTTQVTWKLSLPDANIILEELRVARALAAEQARTSSELNAVQKRHLRERSIQLDRIIREASA